MIYTLSLNPALDKTVTVPSFTPGSVNRIRAVRTDIGGKGINVSKCLKALGCPSIAVGFFGGQMGRNAVKELETNGIDVLSVAVDEEMRTNLKIVDPDSGFTTDLNEPGPHITPEKMQELTQLLFTALQPGDLLVLSGSLPGGVPKTIYRDLILLAHQKGAQVFLDADGVPLKLALEAVPDLIKPNQNELSRLLDIPLTTLDQITDAASCLLGQGVGAVLVSLGENGALLVRPDGIWKADGLQVPVQSTVGAGDSMVAAMAYSQITGTAPAEQLRLATAISTASVMQTGTQAPDKSLIDSLIPRIHIIPII